MVYLKLTTCHLLLCSLRPCWIKLPGSNGGVPGNGTQGQALGRQRGQQVKGCMPLGGLAAARDATAEADDVGVISQHLQTAD